MFLNFDVAWSLDRSVFIALSRHGTGRFESSVLEQLGTPRCLNQEPDTDWKWLHPESTNAQTDIGYTLWPDSTVSAIWKRSTTDVEHEYVELIICNG